MNFEDVLDKEPLVFVMFKTRSCESCRPIQRFLEEEIASKAATFIVDCKDNMDLVGKYSVQRTPTVIVFRNGLVQSVIEGVQAREKFFSYLRQV